MTRGRGLNGARTPQARHGPAPDQGGKVEESARRALCAYHRRGYVETDSRSRRATVGYFADTLPSVITNRSRCRAELRQFRQKLSLSASSAKLNIPQNLWMS